MFIALLGLLTSNQNTSVWIGFADLLGKYRFLWSNSDPVKETFWAAQQPGGSRVSALHGCICMREKN